jgi:DNA polymerase
MEINYKLLDQIKNCHDCPLTSDMYAGQKYSVGTGPSVMFVGEAPGEFEGKKKIPFVGRSGIMLQTWINYLGITNYLVTNAVKHRPTDGTKNLTPTAEEVSICKDRFLLHEIEEYKPALIIFVGRISASIFSDGTKSMSSLVRESMEHNLTYLGYPIIIIYHPSFVLRSGYDMKWILDNIKEKIESLNMSVE